MYRTTLLIRQLLKTLVILCYWCIKMKRLLSDSLRKWSSSGWSYFHIWNLSIAIGPHVGFTQCLSFYKPACLVSYLGHVAWACSAEGCKVFKSLLGTKTLSGNLYYSHARIALTQQQLYYGHSKRVCLWPPRSSSDRNVGLAEWGNTSSLQMTVKKKPGYIFLNTWPWVVLP